MSRAATVPGTAADRHALAGDGVAGDPGDGGLAEAVGEAEVLAVLAELRRLLHDAGVEAVRRHVAAHALRRPAERVAVVALERDEDVDVALAQALVPRGGRAVARVADPVGARRHAGAEVVGEAREQPAGEAQRLEALVGERDVAGEARLLGPLGLARDRVGLGREPPARRLGRCGVVAHAREEVAGAGEVVAPQDVALDVVGLERAHAPLQARHAACSADGVIRWPASAKAPISARRSSAAPTSASVAPGEPITEKPTESRLAATQRANAAGSAAPG